jgi:hypothetical protein
MRSLDTCPAAHPTGPRREAQAEAFLRALRANPDSRAGRPSADVAGEARVSKLGCSWSFPAGSDKGGVDRIPWESSFWVMCVGFLLLYCGPLLIAAAWDRIGARLARPRSPDSPSNPKASPKKVEQGPR